MRRHLVLMQIEELEIVLEKFLTRIKDEFENEKQRENY